MHIEIQNCFSFCGTSSPRPPTGASPLDPTGGLLSPRPPAQDVPHILYQVYAPGRRQTCIKWTQSHIVQFQSWPCCLSCMSAWFPHSLWTTWRTNAYSLHDRQSAQKDFILRRQLCSGYSPIFGQLWTQETWRY